MTVAYLPCSVGVLAATKPHEFIDLEPSIEAAKWYLNNPDRKPLADNLSNADINIVTLSLSVAAELNISVGSVQSKAQTQVIVYEYQRWKDVAGPEGGVVRFGASARCSITVERFDAKASLGGLWGISVSSEAGLARNSCKVEARGVRPGALMDAIPEVTQINKTTYVTLEHAFTKSIPKLIQDEQHLDPELLGIFGETKDADDERQRLTAELSRSVAATYALTTIAQRKALDRTVEYARQDEAFRRIMREIYAVIAGITAEDEKPSNLAKARAREVLDGFETERSD